jgi:hypothetical protein
MAQDRVKGERILSITVEKIIDQFILIYQPDHHRAYQSGYVAEHVLVAEERLGRELSPDEEVKHINGKLHDNRAENLYITSSGSYKTISVAESANPNPKAARNYLPCRFQKPCWNEIRAPKARKNKLFFPYICSFQTEGDIYDCGNFWNYMEKEGESNIELQSTGTSEDDL